MVSPAKLVHLPDELAGAVTTDKGFAESWGQNDGE